MGTNSSAIQPLMTNVDRSSFRALAAIKELQARQAIRDIVDDICFDKQLEFVKSDAKRKALFCSRRSGKSNTLGVYLVTEALKYPRRKLLYLGLTPKTAEAIIWTDIIQRILDERKIHYQYNKLKKLITFDNLSTILIAGTDATQKEMKKLLGGRAHLVVIDECQDQTQDLRQLVDEVLSPLVTDFADKGGGIICMAGTPGTVMGEHMWYQVTKQTPEGLADPDRLPGWQVFEWHVSDNPYMVKQFAMECESLAKSNPNYQQEPAFRRQWLCKWVTETTQRVYKFHEKRNLLAPITKDPAIFNSRVYAIDEKIKDSLLRKDPKWQFIVGCDLGWEDDTAFVVSCYSPEDETFYIVESKSYNHITVAEIGVHLLAIQSQYQPIRFVLDTGGGGKLVAQSLQQQYKIPIVPAIKTEKENQIGLMNSDFVIGKIKVIKEKNLKLIEEWQTLKVDGKKALQGVFKEGDRYRNHLADAALYAFRDSRHHYSKAPEIKEPDFADRLIAKQQQARYNPFRERDWLDKQDEINDAKSIVENFRGKNKL